MAIVVTGLGIVAPVGNSVPAFWDAVCRGASGIRELTAFPLEGFAFTRGGEVRDFALPAPLAERAGAVDRATGFLLAAADEALRDAGLAADSPLAAETAVVVSTNFGAAGAFENALAAASAGRACAPADAAECPFATAADRIAALWNFGGPRAVLSLSCASGTAALGYGAGLIRAGRATAVVAAGYDGLSRFAWSGLAALRTMTRDETRPFDRRRDGTLFSEGAGVLLLEDADAARRRGARVLAELAGYGLGNNAHHMTAPAKRGAGSAMVMRQALADAGLPPEAIDHINAHGTGTKYNDVTETEAIKDVFGPHAAHMPITSIKSTIGHMMGAAGAAEAIATVLSLRDGIVPPTMHYADPDPECDLDVVVNAARAVSLRAALSNSAGIGGCNACVIFRRGEGRP